MSSNGSNSSAGEESALCQNEKEVKIATEQASITVREAARLDNYDGRKANWDLLLPPPMAQRPLQVDGRAMAMHGGLGA